MISPAGFDLLEEYMARALNVDIRRGVLAAAADGTPARSAAARFGIGGSTAIAWIATARRGLAGPVRQARPGEFKRDGYKTSDIGMMVTSKDINAQ